MKHWGRLIFLMSVGVGHASMLAANNAVDVDYRLLATNKTSTMERELNEAALDGFVLVQAMGGNTELGGEELVAVVERDSALVHAESYDYLVLATNRTGTMQNELNDAARRGFAFVTQTVFTTAFGGDEVVIIMERSPYAAAPVCEYELLATSRTSTMEKELSEYGRKGFLVRALSVFETAFGGNEVVVLPCVAELDPNPEERSVVVVIVQVVDACPPTDIEPFEGDALWVQAKDRITRGKASTVGSRVARGETERGVCTKLAFVLDVEPLKNKAERVGGDQVFVRCRGIGFGFLRLVGTSPGGNKDRDSKEPCKEIPVSFHRSYPLGILLSIASLPKGREDPRAILNIAIHVPATTTERAASRRD